MRTKVSAPNNYLVYKHTCTITGKSYVGQTKNLIQRTVNHKNPNSRCFAFRNAIQKYGWDAFTTEVLAEGLTIEKANDLESQFIARHNTLIPQGYNLTTGGLNRVVTEETKKKLRKLWKNRSPELVERMHVNRIGLKRTQEQKQRMSRAQKGRVHSEETKQKMSASHIGKPKPIVTCPSCGKVGGGNAMYRWHFDNCTTIKKESTSCV